MNREDNSTYLEPDQCNYLVDSNIGTPNTLEPSYATRPSQWEIIARSPILNAVKSNQIFRAFYVPLLSEKNTVFANLYLLRNTAFNVSLDVSGARNETM